ncbi:MAG: hypothetical protein KIT84_42090 [Labilithrix sp.]|nr:hypothetical protein [Labilithrix sp.]MCW5817666.1 hypothetical protein [Labilithrix sp.]
MQPKAPWMSPGAPRMAKPSWLRMRALADAVTEVESSPPSRPASPPSSVQLIASVPPPRSMRPSVPPPPSSRRGSPHIQTTRELELEREVAALQSELARVVAESASTRARVIEESEPAIVKLALAIARRVVGREVESDPALMQAWIDEALAMLPGGEVALAEDGASAIVRAGDSTVEVGAEPRMAAIADALGVGS